jgi:hypothetical protein
MVEGPKATFSFEAITDAFDSNEHASGGDVQVAADSATSIADAPYAQEEDAGEPVVKRARLAQGEDAPAASQQLDASSEVIAKAAPQAVAEHRKTAWQSFHGAGLFSEEWSKEQEEGIEEGSFATLVKSTTTATGAWASISDEEGEEQEEEGEEQEEGESEDDEARAEREADEAVAEAERELAAELAAEQYE